MMVPGPMVAILPCVATTPLADQYKSYAKLIQHNMGLRLSCQRERFRKLSGLFAFAMKTGRFFLEKDASGPENESGELMAKNHRHGQTLAAFFANLPERTVFDPTPVRL